MDTRNNIATDLFYKIRSRFTNLKLGKETGEITIIPEEARFFDFDYSDHGETLGHVTISLAELNSIKVYFSAGIAKNMNKKQKQNWYKFLKEMRVFAKRRLLNFDVRDISKDNLDRRDFKFITQNTKQPVEESKSYGTRRTSYQKLQDSKLIIKHSKRLPEDNELRPGARSRNIEAIFIENQNGERFRYPFKHLAGARAMQRHVANGGTPYDSLGQHMIAMSEELGQIRNFNRYVNRNGLVNEATQEIVEQSQQYATQLKNTIGRLSSQKFYSEFSESFSEQERESLSDEQVQQLEELFTVKRFQEDIKSVFPVISKFVTETTKETSMKRSDEFSKFEEWAMSLGETEMPEPAQSQSTAPINEEFDVQELAEFITSFYDKETRTFPKGPEGVCSMVRKQYGEVAENAARALISRMAPDQHLDEIKDPNDTETLDMFNSHGDIKTEIRNAKHELIARLENPEFDSLDYKEHELFDELVSKFGYNPKGSDKERKVAKMLDDFQDWAVKTILGYIDFKEMMGKHQMPSIAKTEAKDPADYKTIDMFGDDDEDSNDEDNEDDEIVNELDYQSFSSGEELQELRDAIDRNIIVSVAFVKKDGKVRHMSLKKSLSAYVHSDREKSDAQRNVESNHNKKRVIDINVYKNNLQNLRASGMPDNEAKAAAARNSWRMINLDTVLGFSVRGKFIDLRDENDILSRFGEEVYNSLTPQMKKTVAADSATNESFLNQEEILEEHTRLKRLAGL